MDTEMMDSCPPAVTITTTSPALVDNNNTPAHILNPAHTYPSHAPLPGSSFSGDSFAQYYNNPVPGLLSPPFFTDHQLAMNITTPAPVPNLNPLGTISPFALSMASAAPPLLTLSPRDAMIKEDPNKEYNDYYLSQLDKVPSFFGPTAMSSSSYPGDNPLQLVISNNDDDKLHFDNDLYYHTRDDDLFFDLDDEFDDMDPINPEGVVGKMEMDNNSYDTDYDSNDYDDYDDLMFSSEEDMDDDYDDSKSAVNASSSATVNATTAAAPAASTVNPNNTNMTAPVSTTPVVMMPSSNKSSDLAAASYRQTHNPPREVISNDSTHLPVTTNVHKNNNTTTNNNNNNVHSNVHNNNTYHHHHPIPSSSLSASSHRCEMINHNTNEPCHKVFSRPYDLVRHQDTIHAPVRQKFACELCGNGGKTFSRMDALSRHIRVKHADAVGYPTPAATITHINH